MAKLWEKTYSLDALMEAFTVGSDPETYAVQFQVDP